MKLKKIEVYGFRRKDIVATLELSQNQFSFIYGKNGIGKTTFLELIYAIFDKNEKKMISENVKSVKIGFIDNKYREIFINSNYEDNEISYDWRDFDDNNLGELNVLYITTQRALNEYRDNITVEMLAYYLNRKSETNINFMTPYYELSDFCNFINGTHKEEISQMLGEKNVCVNSFKISDVSELVRDYHSFFVKANEVNETICLSEILKDSLKYMDDREKYFNEKNKKIEYKDNLTENEKKILNKLLEDKVDLIFRILKLDNSSGINYSITRQIKNAIEKYKRNTKDMKSLNIFETLTNKKIYVSDDLTEVDYMNERHDLTKLSHGERHLLTLLTLIEFVGNGKSIILIDEPCIALDTDWQEKLVEMFSEITDVPFLIATHSPYVSEDYLNDQIEILGGLK